MTDDRQATSAAGGARGYKRSWKNLLINKRYQLRFTLFMVIVAALLMGGLGWWVLRVANEATEVAESRIRGEVCAPLPEMRVTTPLPAEPAPAPVPDGDAPDGAAGGDGDAAGDADGDAAVDAADDAAEGAAPAGGRRRVQIDESSMTISNPVVSPVPEGFAAAVADHYACVRRQGARLDDLARGRRTILLVLIASGALLTLGLAAFGIKMTHRVAGPLYKVSLYMGKMRDGRYDKVYNLRKGDQLVEFYEHFKAAHAGVVALEQADVERLHAALAAADAAGIAGRSPEVDAAIAELRDVLARKEKALE